MVVETRGSRKSKTAKGQKKRRLQKAGITSPSAFDAMVASTRSSLP